MDAPSNEAYQYPNVQQKLMPEQKLYTKIEQKPVDKFKHIVDTIGSTVGYGWIFASILVGGSVIAVFVFKTQIKKRFGEILKWLSDTVNK